MFGCSRKREHPGEVGEVRGTSGYGGGRERAHPRIVGEGIGHIQL